MTTLVRLDVNPQPDWAGDRERIAERCRELCVACEQSERLGQDVAALESELDEARSSLAAIDDVIMAMPAESFADIVLKARLVQSIPAWCRQPDETEGLLAILTRDIERLARP
jgi:hypothetical protein